MKLINPRYQVSYEHIGSDGMWSKDRWTAGTFSTYVEAQHERNAMAARADRRHLEIEMTGQVRLPIHTPEDAALFADAEWHPTPPKAQPPKGDQYVAIVGDPDSEVVIWGPYTKEQLDQITVQGVTKVKLRPDDGVGNA